jgi:hypothetical protein
MGNVSGKDEGQQIRSQRKNRGEIRGIAILSGGLR